MNHSPFFGGEFISAKYVAIDRSVIDATFKAPDGSLFSYPIVADMNEEAYKRLLNYTNVETIERTTRLANEAISQEMLGIAFAEAKKQGYDLSAVTLDKTLRKIVEYDGNQEFLTALKLKCFELDAVASSNNTVVKAKMRKATTPIETLKAMLEIIEAK